MPKRDELIREEWRILLRCLCLVLRFVQKSRREREVGGRATGETEEEEEEKEEEEGKEEEEEALD